jgi:hypothetical protein
MDDAKCSGMDTTVFLNRELLAKALGFGLTRIELIDARSPQRFSNGGRQMIVMPVRADASPTPAKSAPSSAPASAAAPTNPPPQPAELPKEENTMPENNGNTTAAKRATEPTAAEKPALETAIAQIEIVRGDFRNAIAGLNKLASCSSRRSAKTRPATEIQSVRQTLRSLQSVRI